MIRRFWITIGACVAAATLSACQTASADRFYTLFANDESITDRTASIAQAYSVAVGPATLPDIIDRPQFVVRRGQNQVAIIEQHRWAEPLRTGIPRTIAADLRALLPDAQVMMFSSSASRDATYRILLDIERFESIPGTGVTVHAVWRIRQGATNVLATRQSRIDEPVNGEGYDQLAAAHGRALEKISGEMADVLQSLHAGKQSARP